MTYVDPALRREVFGWTSPRMGIDMPIVRYGTWGRALVLFPTAAGDFLEAERMWLIKAIEPLIFDGRVTVFGDRQHQPSRLDGGRVSRCPRRRDGRRSTRPTSRRRSCRTSAACCRTTRPASAPRGRASARSMPPTPSSAGRTCSTR